MAGKVDDSDDINNSIKIEGFSKYFDITLFESYIPTHRFLRNIENLYL